MTTFELVILGIILAFAFVGFWVGLFQAAGSLLGVFVGTALAARYYESVASFILPLFGGNVVAASVTSFIVIFLAVSRLLGVVIYLVNKAFKLLSVLPGVALANRVAGFFLGLLEGILAVGILLYLVTQLPVSQETRDMLASSWLLSALQNVGSWIVPLVS